MKITINTVIAGDVAFDVIKEDISKINFKNVMKSRSNKHYSSQFPDAQSSAFIGNFNKHGTIQ